MFNKHRKMYINVSLHQQQQHYIGLWLSWSVHIISIGSKGINQTIKKSLTKKLTKRKMHMSVSK